MAEIEYPGVVQLIERVVWDHEAESLSLSTRTKIPLKSLISEGFFLFFVYCGADDDITPMLLYANTRHTQKYFISEQYSRQIGNLFTSYFSRAGVDELFMKSAQNLRALFK